MRSRIGTYSVKPPKGVRIDHGHPLAQGIIRAWLFNAGAGLSTRDLVVGDVLTNSRVNADTGYQSGPRGLEFAQGSGGYFTGMLPVDYPATVPANAPYQSATTQISVACGFRIPSTNGTVESTPGVGTGGVIFSTRRNSNAYSATLMYSNGPGPLVACFVMDAPSTLMGASGTTVITPGVDYVIVGTVDQRTIASSWPQGLFSIYVNGGLEGQNNYSPFSLIAHGFSPGQVCGVGRSPGASSSSSMYLRFLYVWGARALNESEVRELAANPWAFVYPFRYSKKTHGAAAAAPSISLSPPTGLQGSSLTITITGTNTHFASGVTTVSFSGSGITVGTVTVTSPTSLAAAIKISPLAATGGYSVTATTGSENPSSSFSVTAGHQRGNIDYDQVRWKARQGSGAQFQMFGGGSPTAGNAAVYDANGNVIDGGVTPGGGGPGGVLPIRDVSANTAMTTSDYTVVALAPSITITLPASPSPGMLVHVKNGNTGVGQTITAAGAGGALIDQSSTVSLGATASLQAQWDGTQWRIL